MHAFPQGSSESSARVGEGAGGDTNLATGRLLCQRHHTLAHDTRYQTKTTPTRKVTFTRRA